MSTQNPLSGVDRLVAAARQVVLAHEANKSDGIFDIEGAMTELRDAADELQSPADASAWVDANVVGNPILKRAMKNFAGAPAAAASHDTPAWVRYRDEQVAKDMKPVYEAFGQRTARVNVSDSTPSSGLPVGTIAEAMVLADEYADACTNGGRTAIVAQAKREVLRKHLTDAAGPAPLHPADDPVVAWMIVLDGERQAVTLNRNEAGGWKAADADVRELVERPHAARTKNGERS